MENANDSDEVKLTVVPKKEQELCPRSPVMHGPQEENRFNKCIAMHVLMESIYLPIDAPIELFPIIESENIPSWNTQKDHQGQLLASHSTTIQTIFLTALSKFCLNSDRFTPVTGGAYLVNNTLML